MTAIVMPIKRERILARFGNFLRVGYLLHCIGLVSLILCFAIAAYTIENIPLEREFAYVFFMWLSSFFFMNTLFSQLDAYSRYQNFKQVRDQLYAFGFQERIVKPLAKSNCQRLAAVLAAKRTGNAHETKTFYQKLGYRWFNVLPDFAKNNPLFIFHPFFWKSTFFVKRYRSRYF